VLDEIPVQANPPDSDSGRRRKHSLTTIANKTKLYTALAKRGASRPQTHNIYRYDYRSVRPFKSQSQAGPFRDGERRLPPRGRRRRPPERLLPPPGGGSRPPRRCGGAWRSRSRSRLRLRLRLREREGDAEWTRWLRSSGHPLSDSRRSEGPLRAGGERERERRRLRSRSRCFGGSAASRRSRSSAARRSRSRSRSSGRRSRSVDGSRVRRSRSREAYMSLSGSRRDVSRSSRGLRSPFRLP
jgi:hypothetical protein